jgi:hypothetical protein
MMMCVAIEEPPLLTRFFQPATIVAEILLCARSKKRQEQFIAVAVLGRTATLQRDTKMTVTALFFPFGARAAA